MKKDLMPLEFESLSHGKIAFGFFNIETDMLLLNQYFFFADDFCHHISQAACIREEVHETAWNMYRVDHQNIGNLMGAIHGLDHRGFIGEVYKHYPFPARQEDFKQKPEGHKNRPTIEGLVQQYGTRISLPVVIQRKNDNIAIGEYVFNRASFHELIRYVWRGGLPRWQDEVRPDYVQAMKATLEQSHHSLFERIFFS